jgi:EAL domain-containing protein (putative c-di-GMP-specific phosphodiesterase class I)
MTDPARTLPVLQRLHGLGLVLSVDDFGTGYSSLAYLSQLPVDEIKIDKGFVMGMGSDAGTRTIVRAVVDLGHNLGLRVVAEGVEDQASRLALIEMGCAVAQGFFFSRPMPVAALHAWVATTGDPAAAGAHGATQPDPRLAALPAARPALSEPPVRAPPVSA